eukprot:TRINITY_DN58599_c0_g1_i6.p1 TRINITY_DN58599_c0_g1~~TRINITY_DN58599_c0_g1_i6.p1  ORF type:complete len:450 (+),score=110.19 TRINITY_DN58599_c0_g1_i6:1259-2608(+)
MATPLMHNFKSIRTVPEASDVVDMVLGDSQASSSTHYEEDGIVGIRGFHTNKVKSAGQICVEKLGQILQDFPKLDEVHPFYGDLINVLFDKDHYTLALGQLKIAQSLVENITKDYLRLLRFGDSEYRCNILRTAAVNRITETMEKHKKSLVYLEQVRLHLTRLPAIDPGTPTLLLTGYPNVGKSSFMNMITGAEVEVRPYPFTTKSLFVGNVDHKNLHLQVIDTPGLLDHPLDEKRNAIEMQAIAALAHLNCAVLFFIDFSETCGFSIKQQVALLQSLESLFGDKPVVLVASKSDVRKLNELSFDEVELLTEAAQNRQIVPMSVMSLEGVEEARSKACELLLLAQKARKILGSGVQSTRISKQADAVSGEPGAGQEACVVRKFIDKLIEDRDDMKCWVAEKFDNEDVSPLHDAEQREHQPSPRKIGENDDLSPQPSEWEPGEDTLGEQH